MCMLINIVNFVLLSLVKLGYFGTCPGGWVGEIKNNDQLSPAETETRAELGNNQYGRQLQNSVGQLYIYPRNNQIQTDEIWRGVIAE